MLTDTILHASISWSADVNQSRAGERARLHRRRERHEARSCPNPPYRAVSRSSAGAGPRERLRRERTSGEAESNWERNGGVGEGVRRAKRAGRVGRGGGPAKTEGGGGSGAADGRVRALGVAMGARRRGEGEGGEPKWSFRGEEA